MNLKVVTWNIRHGLGTDNKQDISRIADELLKTDADIYAIQEVDICANRSNGIDQVAYLSKRLDMPGYFARFFAYDGGDYGLATFTKHKLINADEIIFSSRSERSYRGMYLNLEIKGIKITHLNVHLPSNRSSICWRNVMKIKPSKRIILSGDFNQGPDAEDIKKMKLLYKDINEQNTHPKYTILDYNFSNMTPVNTCVYKTIASDHYILETKYIL